MKRPVLSRTFTPAPVLHRSGYTLVEILVSTTLSLILLGAVVRMFGDVGQSITDSRAMLESSDRLRIAASRLQMDLAGVTVTMNPPRRPENNEGYFEYIEGPMTQATASTCAVNSEATATPADTTVGDFDDILMFTTRSLGRPFVGRVPTSVAYPTGTIQSDVAEVAWFVRGRTLYRRLLLVAPSASLTGIAAPYYANSDISAHLDSTGTLVANTLGDLTKRENRFAHPGSFPYDARVWHWSAGSPSLTMPTLPTLRECSSSGWAVGTLPSSFQTVGTLDFWSNDPTKRLSDQQFGSSNLRIADDVILTNVIGFDVKAWDPHAGILKTDNSQTPAAVSVLMPGDPNYTTAWTNIDKDVGSIHYGPASFGAYVDLGYMQTSYAAAYAADPIWANGFSHWGHPRSGLNATAATAARVYDTYSFHYENDGVRQTLTAPSSTGSIIDAATNGFDDIGSGVVDEIVYNGAPTAGENETAPPYPVPLRGIQVKIRVFEPDSRQILEWTVVQDFLPQ